MLAGIHLQFIIGTQPKIGILVFRNQVYTRRKCINLALLDFMINLRTNTHPDQAIAIGVLVLVDASTFIEEAAHIRTAAGGINV